MKWKKQKESKSNSLPHDILNFTMNLLECFSHLHVTMYMCKFVFFVHYFRSFFAQDFVWSSLSCITTTLRLWHVILFQPLLQVNNRKGRPAVGWSVSKIIHLDKKNNSILFTASCNPKCVDRIKPHWFHTLWIWIDFGVNL